MGYRLLVMPLATGEEPGSRAAELIAEAERRSADPAREARKRRLVDRLRVIEPRFGPVEKDAGAIAAEMPELADGQVANLARTVDLDGWPGIQIGLADDWVDLEIATWPELASPETVDRLTELIGAICAATGWICVDGERNVALDDARTAAERAIAGAAGWGDRVSSRLHDGGLT